MTFSPTSSGCARTTGRTASKACTLALNVLILSLHHAVEVVKFINNLVVLLSEQFLVHNAVHRPLRRLLRSCIGDDPEDKVEGSVRVFGAASYALSREDSEEEDALEGDLVDLMCVLCSRMRA